MPRTEIPGKFTPERSVIAHQLIEARRFDLERPGGYRNCAASAQYRFDLNGLDHFFDYVRRLGGNKTVLDLAAGTTVATTEFQSQEGTSDLNFIATVLRRIEEKGVQFDIKLPLEKVLKTSVERLEGIENASVSGIISHSGLAYSQVPEIAVGSIDRILVSGGVIKADLDREQAFRNPQKSFSYRNPYGSFVDEFTRLGYDVAHETWRGSEIILAIKPGGGTEISALGLLESEEAVPGFRAWEKSQGIKFDPVK